MQTFRDRLIEARRMSGLSARELSRLIGGSHAVISHFESGHVDAFDAGRLGRLADVFGVSVDWMLNGKGDAPVEAEVLASATRARAAAKGAA